MRSFISSSITALSLFSLVGCGQNIGFSEAVPSSEALVIDFPASSSTAKVSLSEPMPLADPASCYESTLDLATRANDWVKNVLTTLDRVTDYRAKRVDEDTYQWGPKEDADNNVSEQLQVTTNADGSYDYEFQAAPLGTTDFQAYIDGHIDAGSTHTVGTGTFSVLLDVVQELDPDRGVAGTMDFTYALNADTSRSIDVILTDVLFSDGAQHDATLSFNRHADATGQLDWSRTKDVYDPDTTDAVLYEDLAYRARWQADRAGRCDGNAVNGDLGTSVVTAHQCWDTATAEVYFQKEIDGTEVTSASRGSADQCAISDVQYPE